MQEENVSRRGFLGATAGGIGLAAAGAAVNLAMGQTAEAQEAPKKKKGIHVGMLTAPFAGETMETVVAFAKSANISALEVVAGPGTRLLDPADLSQQRIEEIKKLIAESGLEISSLSYYSNILKNTDRGQAHALKTIDAAVALGVPTVCMIAGMPPEDKTKIQTIKEVMPKAFEPILAKAKDKGINIALENWFETCLQGLDTFECFFDTFKEEYFGLNYDPSHLYHQECDYYVPVSLYSKRIFHTHAKDTFVDRITRAKVGIRAEGWWRYVIPGFGSIDWPNYIAHLRGNGYKGVLSIEHEDGDLGREEGFTIGARYLNQFC
jgi:sugar phosphate isomerase/epimerase